MTRFALPLLIALASAASGIAPGTAHAGSGTHADVDILPGWRQDNGAHMAALRIILDDGWKTYWRAPGEAGIPPRFDWSGSQNLGEVRLHWPVPEVIVSNGVTTLGFVRELVLPIEVVPLDPGADIVVEAGLAFGICKDVCMPLQTEVSAVLPAAATVEESRIKSALAARPDTAQEASVASTECEFAPIADGLRVTARIDMPEAGPGEFVVVEPEDRSIWVSQAMVSRVEGHLVAQADLVPPNAAPFDLDPETLRITVLAQGRAVDILGCSERD